MKDTLIALIVIGALALIVTLNPTLRGLVAQETAYARALAGYVAH